MSGDLRREGPVAHTSLKAATVLALALAATAAQATERDAIAGMIAQNSASEPPLTAHAPVAEPSAPTVPPAPRASRPAAPRSAATPIDGYPVDLLIALANDAVFTSDPYPRGQHSDPRMIKLQVLLDRAHASPGVIDGINGGNVAKAIAAFEMMVGHPIDGVMDAELWAKLEATSAEPVLVPYVITDKDIAGPFVPVMPDDYAEQALLPGSFYRDPVEMLAERFHMDENFLRRLNPDVDFFAAGTEIMVANPGRKQTVKVASIVADKGRKQLFGFDASGKIVVAYPATIGSADLPSPTGIHAVKAIAINPEYWYRPKVNFQQGNNTKALRLPPGPNAPVGAVWIGLDKPTYGLHGTPEPSRIDKTNSHGCVRLTNWDADELAHLVAPGVVVDFREPEMAPAQTAETEPLTTGSAPARTVPY
ncbi:signal peptide [Methylopila sp. Yamaguchi]|nr:signal peptide [Methylopila sp. Yamaguchi]